MAKFEVDEILPPLSEEDKMLSGLAYPAWFVIPGFILFSSKKEDPFLCFHALQGLFFGLFSVLATLCLMLGTWVMFQVLPKTGGTLWGLMGAAVFGAGMLAMLFVCVVYIFLGWQASTGHFLRLPLLGEAAESRMATMLELDLDDLRKAAVPRSIQPVSKPVEQVQFPDAQRIDPQAVRTYATNLIRQGDQQQQQPPNKDRQKPQWPRASGDPPGGGGPRRW